MPQKHFYFSLGALFGTFLVSVLGRFRHRLRKSNTLVDGLYRKDEHWFLYFPVAIFVFGCFALIPDVLHALKLLPKEVTRGPIFDIFFFHSTFERIEDQYPILNQYLNWAGEIVLGLLSVGVMIYYVLQVKRSLRVRVSKRLNNSK